MPLRLKYVATLEGDPEDHSEKLIVKLAEEQDDGRIEYHEVEVSPEDLRPRPRTPPPEPVEPAPEPESADEPQRTPLLGLSSIAKSTRETANLLAELIEKTDAQNELMLRLLEGMTRLKQGQPRSALGSPGT